MHNSIILPQALGKYMLCCLNYFLDLLFTRENVKRYLKLSTKQNIYLKTAERSKKQTKKKCIESLS